MANIRTMRFHTTPGGCYVCVSHKHNDDGYLRKGWRVGDHHEMEMFHRFIYRINYGLCDIPVGYEIHHSCENRACCNIKHLELIKRDDHLTENNHNRYAGTRAAAFEYWTSNPDVTGTKLGKLFGRSFGQCCRWIREWKETH